MELVKQLRRKFFYKSSPCTKHNWHFSIRFLINAAPLNVYYILHCHSFLSEKKFFFSNVYISLNTIFEWSDLLFGWEIGHPLRTYATGVIEGRSFKKCTGRYWGRGVEKLVIKYVRTKWMAPNKCCKKFLCIGWAKHPR